ncbi:MAG TPA: hypothetical protein VIM93_05225 [Kangiella sp.]|uniref:hypothetical protein n=1 Tax=Kangiella sp. TaxID=1920245 RepID=UPI002F9368F2
MKTLTLNILLLISMFGMSYTMAEEPQKHFGYFKVSKDQIGEACPELKKGQQLTYKVKSNKPVQFNFHFHQGDEVTYPVEDHETQLIEKTFVAEIDETYCLMWTGLEDNSTIQMEYFIQ